MNVRNLSVCLNRLLPCTLDRQEIVNFEGKNANSGMSTIGIPSNAGNNGDFDDPWIVNVFKKMKEFLKNRIVSNVHGFKNCE